ncbi:APG12-domain-containing protein [Mytilinidion resinicola]|uniref:Ubiquitin-like protein ATG12 n=1 Tax=Mytilinidion resinicola TaxID=574789 RepID=A0A6A6Y7V8_9PEZI|nr:APG12-domain-containing protein [Mytilinidion resinicola]KAF2804623.1 APG12-domain-containing protein [Mytilinidion resinicola]
MSSPPSPESSVAANLPIEDEEDATDIPLTMAASVVLTSLPRDAAHALEGAGELGVAKVQVRLLPVGAAPALKQQKFMIRSSQRFEVVVSSLRNKLRLGAHESLNCYVNSVFAPAPDEGVGNLWRCFKTNEELVVAYSITPAFG